MSCYPIDNEIDYRFFKMTCQVKQINYKTLEQILQTKLQLLCNWRQIFCQNFNHFDDNIVTKYVKKTRMMTKAFTIWAVRENWTWTKK
ncbi:hypothetical protein [Moraxella equi]|uniref:Uncharacterized protein n=1 Tax=Moraxella equi TaxID=60442 RepID=A0A378QU83_9GAMM|nr:hypothetical protein [Moraxella equi]OPH35837.1 hypothetical protein B5J93_10155 [Moraxella equi]STZ03854.1 Uncharacterised protein [Moraxella equi]